MKTIGGIKGTFHARMGMINGEDPTRAEEVKKSWEKHAEELYKKGLNDPDNHSGVVNHLDSDILECEVDFRKHYHE